MSRPRKKPLITDRRLIRRPTPEKVLLHITHTLHHKPNRKQHHARNVPPRPEIRLPVLRHIRTIQHRDGQGNKPYPEHLEDPEPEEGKEFIAFVVEAVVFAGFEDAEEQEAGEAETPEHNEEGGDDLAGIVVAAEGEGDDCEGDEVCSAGEVWGVVSLGRV